MQNDFLVINKIEKKNNIIKCSFDFGIKWAKFLSKKDFFVKYDQNIENVPDSIAIIPLVCNILPIMWLFDLKIEVNELDKKFFESISKIKKGYIDMHPKLTFTGDINVKKIVENEFDLNNSAVMFSGGVDAFSTLISNIEKKPDLITIFGADIALNDEVGIKKVNDLNNYSAKLFGLNYLSIFSNFREIINYKQVNNFVYNSCKCEWWHDFQHGIALLGLTAPLSYVMGYETIFIASSYTQADKGKYTCASDPTIDNNFKHSSSNTIHDGYEKNRQMKIKNICNYVRENNLKLKLRVCWISDGGDNCCQCEKCYRTIMGIIAAGGNPADYGFLYYDKTKKKMIKYLKKYLKYDTQNNATLTRYKPIQDEMKKNKYSDEEYQWFLNFKIARIKPTKLYNLKLFFNKKMVSVFIRIKKIIKNR